jgi:hypothetical protein
MNDAELSNSHFNLLVIDKVIGTSVKSPNQICVRDNLIAYTASGGIVVGEVSSTNNIVNQRFFCANSNFGNVDTCSSADAYLNMAMGESNEQPEVQRDAFGFFIANPIEVSGNSVDFEPSNLGDVDSSPSKLKNRVRNINCITISPDKRLLAMGEIGYNPRILIFSLAPDLLETPIAQIYEHTFGVNSLEFSPDLKYLCSLGLVNDGFIKVWKIQPSSISVYSSNKCSSIINQIIWHESFIITLGLRLIKVWKFEDDQKALKGKNVLLGPCINSNFIKADVLNNDELLLITDLNQLLLLKLTYENLKLISLENPTFKFENFLIDHEAQTIWFGSDEAIESMPIADLKPSTTAPVLSPRRLNNMFNNLSTVRTPILKLASLNSQSLLILNESEEIVLFDKQNRIPTVIQKPLIRNLLGLKNSYSGHLLIYSKDGIVKQVDDADTSISTILTYNLNSIDLIANAMTAIDKSDKLIILGDKLGSLFIVRNNGSNELIYETKAHTSTINDLTYYELNGVEFITSISRDRMIQFFYKLPDSENWDILQTIPLHNGNLLKVQYFNQRVYVCSSDRSISVHRLEIDGSKITIFHEKLLAIKATPIMFAITTNDLVVSTNDKTVWVYDVENYELKRSLKLKDDLINESLLVENFTVTSGLMIAACSDKSLRLVNYQSGRCLYVVWGHLDSIVGLNVKNNKLMSISMDECLIEWNLIDAQVSNPKNKQAPTPKEDIKPMNCNVTRKIIPSVPIPKTPSLKANKTPDPEQNSGSVSPKLTYNGSQPNSGSTSPRLTNATLKRIEARRMNSSPIALSTKLQPSPKRLVTTATSPIKPSFPSLPRSPTKGAIKPPTLPIKSNRPIVVPGMANSSGRILLLKSGAGLKKSKNVTDMILEHLDKVEGLIRDDLDQKPDLDTQSIANKLAAIQKLIKPEKDDDIETAMEHLTLDQPSVVKDLPENNQNQLLEKYSEKLVRMIEMKLEEKSPKYSPYLKNMTKPMNLVQTNIHEDNTDVD